jgi:hypothetical protein
MKSPKLLVAVVGVVLVIAIAAFAWQSRKANLLPVEGAVDADAQIKALTAGLCTTTEAVDRHLLQQTWFHDPAFQRLAGVFGQSSFVHYTDDTPAPKTVHGAFCISGRELLVRYYKTSFVPTSVSLGDAGGVKMQLGTKITPAGTDRITVVELTRQRLVLRFDSESAERALYRNR